MLNKDLIWFKYCLSWLGQNRTSERKAPLAGCHITYNFSNTATTLQRPHIPVPNLQVVVVRFLTLYKLSEGSLLLLSLTYFKVKERTWILFYCCRFKISNAYVPMRSATRLKNVMLETEVKKSNFGRQARLSNSAAVDVSWKSDLRERLELKRRNDKIQLAIGKKWENVLFPLHINMRTCVFLQGTLKYRESLLNTMHCCIQTDWPCVLSHHQVAGAPSLSGSVDDAWSACEQLPAVAAHAGEFLASLLAV